MDESRKFGLHILSLCRFHQFLKNNFQDQLEDVYFQESLGSWVLTTHSKFLMRK